MYAQDKDETLPPSAYDLGPQDVLWPDLLKPYVKYVVISLCTAQRGYSIWQGRTAPARTFDHILKSDALRHCPSDSTTETNSYGVSEMAFSDLTDDDAPPVKTLVAFQTPAGMVMLCSAMSGPKTI